MDDPWGERPIRRVVLWQLSAVQYGARVRRPFRRSIVVLLLLAVSAIPPIVIARSSAWAAVTPAPWLQPLTSVPTDYLANRTSLSLTADGRYLTVYDGQIGPALYDRSTAQRIVVDLGQYMSQLQATITPDGSAILFASSSSDLVFGSGGYQDVFEFELPNGPLTSVTGGLPGSWDYHLRNTSTDGRFVAIDAIGSGSPFSTQVLIVDQLDGSVVHPDATLGGTGATNVSVSDDGRFAAFTSFTGSCATCWRSYRWDRSTGVALPFDGGPGGASPTVGGFEPQISGDGTAAVFTSQATNLVPGTTTVQRRLYWHDFRIGATRLITDDLPGGSNGDASIGTDGTRVAYLANGATGDKGSPYPDSQAFVWDVVDGAHRVSPAPTAETPAERIVLVDLSRDGSTVAYMATGQTSAFWLNGPPIAAPPPPPPPSTTTPTTTAHAAGFAALAPARLLETRSGPGMDTTDHHHLATGPLTAGTTYELPITGRGNIPTGATAASLNLTVTNTAAPGYLTIHPCGTRPNASSINYATNDTVANAVTTKLSPTGTICIYASATTDVIIDANGAFTDPATFAALAPARLLETRSGPGMDTTDHHHLATGPLTAGTTYELPITGRGNIPTGATAASLNLTVTNTAAPGYLTIHPCGTRPNASSINYATNDTVANAVTTKLSPTGTICIYASATTDVIIDANGAFSA